MATKKKRVNAKLSYKVSDILKRVPNRFLLSIAVAKRARQLKEGATPFIESTETLDVDSETPILTALSEIHAEKINVAIDSESQKSPELLDEISDFLDSDMMEEVADTPSDESATDVSDKKGNEPKKRKSLAA